jgi:hypothetical protein
MGCALSSASNDGWERLYHRRGMGNEYRIPERLFLKLSADEQAHYVKVADTFPEHERPYRERPSGTAPAPAPAPPAPQRIVVPAGAVAGTPIQVPGPGGAPFVVEVPPGVQPGQTFAFQVPSKLPVLEGSGPLADPTSSLWYFILPGVSEQWSGPHDVAALRAAVPSPPDGVRVCRDEDYEPAFNEPKRPDSALECGQLFTAATAQAVQNLCMRLPGTLPAAAEAALAAHGFHAGKAFRQLRDEAAAAVTVVAAPVPLPTVIAVPSYVHTGSLPLVMGTVVA